MPELAEIETVRKRLNRAMKGKRITELNLEEGDRYLFAFVKITAVKKALTGAIVKGAGRKGKYFWLELDRRPWPLFHLGMSGNISIVKAKSHARGWGGPKLWREANQDKRLWFSRLLMVLNDGTEVALTDPRRFGRMWLIEGDPLAHPRLKKLGPDPLQDFPPVKELADKLKKRRAPIKSVLLDQALFAGIGNWLADEILFQAKINPHRLASEFDAAAIQRLRDKILSVVKDAVKLDADYDRFPKSWLFHHRWGKNAEAKTSRGHKIVHEQIGGRTAAWVPQIQK